MAGAPERGDILAGASPPYLSIVACSRNDDHGGHLQERTQLFIDGIADQARRFALDCELILVDWNPPLDRPGLADLLRYPGAEGHLVTRVITVPAEVHRNLPHAEALPLFQMIAKNVGIRRSRGRMVLATNIDILFPDPLVARLAARDLDEGGSVYRTDRLDIDWLAETGGAHDLSRLRGLPPLRYHRRDGTYDETGARVLPLYQNLGDLIEYRWRHRRDGAAHRRAAGPETKPTGLVRRGLSDAGKLWNLATIAKPHANGCGDFTMMGRACWLRVSGYAEWPTYSWNIDALLLYQARAYGLHEVVLPPDCSVLHMEHGAGSGWTPEGAAALFRRLQAGAVPVVTNDVLAREARKLGLGAGRRHRPRQYAPQNWGYASMLFEEREISEAVHHRVPQSGGIPPGAATTPHAQPHIAPSDTSRS
jgi:hypothetical protein